MTVIIWLINFIGAILTIIGWLKNPDKKIFAIIGLIFGVLSLATTQFTLVSIIMLIIFFIFIILIYSLKLYSEYEKEIVNAQVLFDGPSRQKIMELSKNIFNKPYIDRTTIARMINFAASKGVEYKDVKDLIHASGVLSIAIQADTNKCVDILIKIQRIFKVNEGYMRIGDRITVSSQKGVNIDEIIAATNKYINECIKPNIININEYFASLVTLGASELRGERAGECLAALLNELTANKDDIIKKISDIGKQKNV